MINSTNLVPDIQYWFEVFVRTSNMNKSLTQLPSTLSADFLLENKSFIRLLFDDNWPTTLTAYTYLFEDITNKSIIPYDFRTRLMLYPSSGKYFQCTDSTSITTLNVFNLQPDDITLLDRLLSYRLDSTGNTIIDIDYLTLSTSLSKLIYLYLDLKINKNYSNFDNAIPLSRDTNLLENCYEMYICESLFNFISNNVT
jgi:hypothetical protein